LARDRRSCSILGEPGPSPAELRVILGAAVEVPDHGQLRPYRFLVVRDDARRVLGLIARDGLSSSDPSAEEPRLKKAELAFLRSPVVVVSVLKEVPGRIPRDEQLACVSAATQNILLAATELGYGSIWRTGALAIMPEIRHALGLDDACDIVAFVHLGSRIEARRPRPLVPLDEVVSEWSFPGGRV
jgi:nitroreductase